MIPRDGHRQAFEAASRTADASANPLLELEEWLTRNTKGTALIRGPKSSRDSVLEFVAARCSARGRAVVHTRTPRGFLSECFRALAILRSQGAGSQVARSEGARDGASSPISAVARTLEERRAVVVSPLPEADTYEAQIIHRFVREASPLVVFFAEQSTLVAGEFDIEIDLSDTLSEADRNLWFQTFAARVAGVQTWASLGSWGARAAAIDATRAELSEDATAALSALVRVERAVPATAVNAAFGSVVDELTREGYLRVSEIVETTALASCFAAASAEATTLASLALATGLATTDQTDWLEAAARVFASANQWDRASETMTRARAHAWDDEARSALDRRWFDHVRVLSKDSARLLDEARVALADGNNDLACAWADLAASTSPECVEAELLLAQAKIASGDARGAEALLSRLIERDLDDANRAIVFAELAEARYLLGDMAGARVHAMRVASDASPASQLDARNTLGKVLLAESSFDAAEAHFLRDEITARESGLEQSMWRARVNRAVAVLSRGDVTLSERILEEVARAGRAKNDPRLLAFAVDNLAVCAMKKREYARALTLLDEAVALRMRLGERSKAARLVGNLAELRLRVGLLDHADHALAFGARLVAQTQLPARRGQLALVAARVALARGRIDEARAKVELAKRELRIASEKEYQNEARVVEARVAFEEGRVEAMHRLLDATDDRGTEPEVLAEILLLRALATRAEGQPCGHLLVRVLDVAESAQADETAIEAHGLMAEVRAADGDSRSATEHLRFAISLRDRVASELPAEIAKAYKARRDFGWMEERVSVARGSDRRSGAAGRTVRSVEDLGPATQRSRSGLLMPAPWAEGDESADTMDEPRSGGSRRSDIVPSPASRAENDTRRPLKAVPPAGPTIVGEHPKMRALLAAVSKVARAPGTVLVQGESGTGKELIATAIHKWSPRAQGPCISVNCAALAEPLLLSELFGHEKGAFTGAIARHRGRFELAEGGTLFLDEIGDISPRTQVALLRVLQEKTYERVGGTSQLRANVRIVCATHKNLRAMVDRGEFREDLYYRLAEITVEVPALRERASDLPALAQTILDRVAGEHRVAPAKLSADALGLLSKYAFPGNVRELENILRSVSLLEDVPVITASELLLHHPALRTGEGRRDSQRAMSAVGIVAPGKSQETATGVAFEAVRSGEMSLPALKRQIERECIQRALVETSGNITKAAELLGMKRPRLSQLVKQYELGEDDAAEDL